MSNVLVVDIGTQSMRGIIFDEHGNLLVKEQIKYKPYLAPENGFMEQDQQMYEDAMFGILRTITANHPDFVKDVVAVSVDTFRDTTVLLDEHNKPVRNTILWSDQRTADVSKKLPIKQRFLFKLVGMDRAIRAATRTRSVGSCEKSGLFFRIYELAACRQTCGLLRVQHGTHSV